MCRRNRFLPNKTFDSQKHFKIFELVMENNRLKNKVQTNSKRCPEQSPNHTIMKRMK